MSNYFKSNCISRKPGMSTNLQSSGKTNLEDFDSLCQIAYFQGDDVYLPTHIFYPHSEK